PPRRSGHRVPAGLPYRRGRFPIPDAQGGTRMRLHRALLAALAAAFLVGVVLVAQTTETAAAKMADAADRLLTSLDKDQKARAAFGFDDKERINWNFVPLEDTKTKTPTRKGLRMEEMTEAQKKTTLELLRAGTSST